MNAIARPLSRVQEATTAFAHDPRVRLVVVETEPNLRPAVLLKFADVEAIIAPPALLFTLESPFEAADANWALRGEELLGEWQTASDALVERKLPPLPALEGSATPVAA